MFCWAQWDTITLVGDKSFISHGLQELVQLAATLVIPSEKFLISNSKAAIQLHYFLLKCRTVIPTFHVCMFLTEHKERRMVQQLLCSAPLNLKLIINNYCRNVLKTSAVLLFFLYLTEHFSVFFRVYVGTIHTG